MIVTPASLSGLFTNYDTQFSQTYAQFKPKAWYQTICMTMQSKTRLNVYAWLGRLPKVREWLGDRFVNNLTTRSYTITNRKYELTVGIPRTDIEDDQYDTYGPWMQMAGISMSKWPDNIVSQFLLNGQASVANANYGAAYDGQNFFDQNHPIDPSGLAGGVQSNYYASGKALSFDNYQTVRANMRALVGEDGNPLGVEPDSLIVPPQLEAVAKTIVESDLMAPQTISGQTFVGAQTNIYKGTAKVIVYPELAAQPNAWYLADCSKPVKPLIWQLRQAPETVYRNQLTDEHVFSADEFLYGVRMRGYAGYGLWFLAAKASA